MSDQLPIDKALNYVTTVNVVHYENSAPEAAIFGSLAAAI